MLLRATQRSIIAVANADAIADLDGRASR